MKPITVGELAQKIDGTCEGDKNVKIYGVSGIKEAKGGEVTFLANSKYLPEVKKTKAAAIIVPYGIEIPFRPIIRSMHPKLSFIKAMKLLIPEKEKPAPGIHPTCIIGKNVKLGKNVYIGPYVVIEDGVEIGNKTCIYAGTYIGRNSKIGNEVCIYSNVTIYDEVTIGDRTIIHSGTVIGSDGFGYTEVDGVHHKMPQIGTVVIEEDVEIGANVTIDRATMGKTWIKSGTKIDNLVQIGHNVVIGKNSIIVAQVGISGSVEIGDSVTIAGQVGIAGHLKIGSRVTIAGRSVVTKNIPPNVCVSGFPARPHKEEQKIQAYVQRLPKLVKKLKLLEEQVSLLLSKNLEDTKVTKK